MIHSKNTIILNAAIMTFLLNTACAHTLIQPKETTKTKEEVLATKLVEVATEDKDNLIETLRACDKALSKCDRAIKDKDEKISAQADLLLQQRNEIDTLKDNSSGLFKQNEFWFLIGALFTGAIMFLTK